MQLVLPLSLDFREFDEAVYAGRYAIPVAVDQEKRLKEISDQSNAKFGTQHPVLSGRVTC